MAIALLAARILLAAVFATAGLAKLADLAGSRRALADFGVPRRLAGPLGVLLPLVELAAAGLLVPDGSARWGALISGVLLLVFAAAIAVNLMRGRAPECQCFGQVHSAPVSWRTVARNLVLAGLSAAVLIAGAGVSLSAAATAAVGAAVLVAATLLVVRKAVAAPKAGLPVGADAPEFSLPALDGQQVTLAALRARGRPVLLVFSDAHCGPCIELAPEVARWQREHAGAVTVAVIERGHEVPDGTGAHGRTRVLRQANDEVSSAYGALGTPSAVLIDAKGKIASHVATGAPAIQHLVPGAPPVRVARVGLTRLELLARAGPAVAALALLGARDVFAGAIPIVVNCKYVRCGGRCCPTRAVCRTRRGKKVCICPDGRETCGAKCCPETFICHKAARGKRICICPPRTRLCRGRCVPLTDAAHCGRCGVTCPPATVCVDGQCVGGDGTGTGPGGAPPCTCPPGQTCCDGACVDLNTDEAHCGRCDQACPPGQECCDGLCRKLQLDPENCGECGKSCPSGLVCNNGRCDEDCAPGTARCGDRCVDTSNDDQNCGGCGRACGGQAPTCCGGSCVALILLSHCGACFRECRAPCACSFQAGTGICTGIGDCPDNPPMRRVIGRVVARTRALLS